MKLLPTARDLRYLLLALPIIAILVLICFYWIDRPLAIWNSSHFNGGQKGWLSFDRAVILTQMAYCVMLPVFIVYYFLRHRVSECKWLQCIQLLCLTVPTSFFIKGCLQFLLGRVTPRYHGSSVLLFVRNPQLYGFHFLQTGGFPSGHMTMLTATLTAISLYYRAFWAFAVLLILIMAALLLMINYHFLSDASIITIIVIIICSPCSCIIY